jgi:hypothetical protein
MAILAIPPLGLAAASLAYAAVNKYFNQNYPASKRPRYKLGEEVEVHGKTLKIIGYTGHSQQTAHNLQLVDHAIWIAQTRKEAQGYARADGAVATIAAKERAHTNYSRFENGVTADFPSVDHCYTVVDVEPVTPETDDRTSACFKRMAAQVFKVEL